MSETRLRRLVAAPSGPLRLALEQSARSWADAGFFWTLEDICKIVFQEGGQGFAFYLERDATNGAPIIDGVLFARLSADTCELLYIYVQPERRGRGLGELLMKALLDALHELPEAKSLYLEVRRSNLRAQKLYAHFGLKKIAERRAYYQDGEDALIYVLAWT